MTQKSRLYDHFKRGRSITRLQAIQDFGCLNLWQRVSELEKSAGLKISREWVKVKNRYGEWTRVIRYRMQ